jgi:hypothetical protein
VALQQINALVEPRITGKHLVARLRRKAHLKNKRSKKVCFAFLVIRINWSAPLIAFAINPS